MEIPYPIRPPQWPAFPSHVQWSGDNRMFSDPECDAIIAAGEAQPQGFATIGNGGNNTGVINREYRTVKSAALWQHGDPELTWLYDRIATKVVLANADYFRFDLTGLGEAVQFLKYEVITGEENGHYKWHQDFGGGMSSNRKLSVVVNLSDPGHYEGCRLELFNERAWESPYIRRGEAIMFPAWTPHQVTEIKGGTRYALAIWVHGPQFR